MNTKAQQAAKATHDMKTSTIETTTEQIAEPKPTELNIQARDCNRVYTFHAEQALIGQDIHGLKGPILSARKIHALLNVEKQFGPWIQFQVDRDLLIAGFDYVQFRSELKDHMAILPATDYALTLQATASIFLEDLKEHLTRHLATRNVTHRHTPFHLPTQIWGFANLGYTTARDLTTEQMAAVLDPKF